MPFYSRLKYFSKLERDRTLAGLIRLRKQLDSELPKRTRDSTLIIGTWNIRNFDDNRFMNGHRTGEDMYYIAEIISRFDVIAVQEICEDLAPLEKVMQILGNEYKYILTDKTEGRSGNEERLGFIYDKAKVSFKGVAGELVLPDNLQIIDGERKRQFSRTPFMCAFQSGWFKFKFSTVHIYYGEDSGAKYERRVAEIGTVAEFLAKRAKGDNSNHILVGDFNIKKEGSAGFNALAKAGFSIIQNRKGSNKDQTKFYDQISYFSKWDQIQISDNDNNKGVLQFFDSIFSPETFPDYRGRIIEALEEKIDAYLLGIEEKEGKIERARSESTKKKYRQKIVDLEERIKATKVRISRDTDLKDYFLKEWRTFHASDHLPLWVELKIDFSTEYLRCLSESEATT